ncbi:PulJ/GspJ family protein [Leucobacter sp. W1153]|uniref:PulJ/GspJ family protein n=1 Tax=Leucobacter sp. W1153 TaxID=3439064 RepID=UPI003F3F036A
MNRNRRVDDAGFSLVELAVYIVVLGLISTIIATTMVSLFRSESTVSGLTTSASDGQNAATLLRADIRNAREFRVTDGGATLTASVAGRSASITWQCVRWQVTGTGNERNLTRDVKPDSAGQPWNAPSSLPTLLTGVGPRSEGTVSLPFFAGGAASGVEGTLTYSWRVTTADEGAINIVGDARNRTQGQVATPATTCF